MRLLKRWVPRLAERASKLISVVSCRKRSTCDSDRLLGQVYIYVRVPRVVVKVFPGETVTKLTDRIRFGQVDISRHERILVHVGINDVDDVLRSRRARSVTPQQVLRKYKVLREVIRRLNSRVPILFSSILPRLKQFMKFKPYVLGLNFALEKWCAKSGGSCVFIPSYRSFLAGGEPREELFAKDGLHLNGAGVDRLEACFQ